MVGVETLLSRSSWWLAVVTAMSPSTALRLATCLSRLCRRSAIAAAVLGAAIAVLVTLLAISTASDGEVSVLIGTLGSDRLASLAFIAAFASLAVGLSLVPVPRLWLLLLVPARLSAVAVTCLGGLAWFLTSGATVVPLVSAGCETGYVVEEESFLLAG